LSLVACTKRRVTGSVRIKDRPAIEID
jgi:hypothetical protein